MIMVATQEYATMQEFAGALALGVGIPLIIGGVGCAIFALWFWWWCRKMK